MEYFFYNTDAKSLPEKDRTQVLIQNRLAVTGGSKKYADYLARLSPGDQVLMYRNHVGVVAVGEVIQPWDGISRQDHLYYISGKAASEPEYHARVDWFLDLRERPLGYKELRRRLGYCPQSALQRIAAHRSEVEKIIAELTEPL